MATVNMKLIPHVYLAVQDHGKHPIIYFLDCIPIDSYNCDDTWAVIKADLIVTPDFLLLFAF